MTDDELQAAVLEERRGDIEFRVVNNDGSHDSFIVLTGLKCIFQKQLPKMPKDYIARLVYDRSHLSIAIVKHPLEVVGYVRLGYSAMEHFADESPQRHYLSAFRQSQVCGNCLLRDFL